MYEVEDIDGTDIQGYPSGGSSRGHAEALCGGRFVSSVTVVTVPEEEDIWEFVANIRDADPPAVDVGKDNSPIFSSTATKLF